MQLNCDDFSPVPDRTDDSPEKRKEGKLGRQRLGSFDLMEVDQHNQVSENIDNQNSSSSDSQKLTRQFSSI